MDRTSSSNAILNEKLKRKRKEEEHILQKEMEKNRIETKIKKVMYMEVFIILMKKRN